MISCLLPSLDNMAVPQWDYAFREEFTPSGAYSFL